MAVDHLAKRELPLRIEGGQTRSERRSSQMGGKRAYNGRLRKDWSPRESRHSIATAKRASQPKPLSVGDQRRFRPASEDAARSEMTSTLHAGGGILGPATPLQRGQSKNAADQIVERQATWPPAASNVVAMRR